MILAHMPTLPPTDRTTQLVADSQTLRDVAKRLKHKPRIALDTEAASFHRYVDRVYLIQISSGEDTALVDPLAVDDLAPIGSLLNDAKLETIFHDADYDLRILDRDYGFRARNLWDTRIAAQLAGETAFGLGALLERYFDLRLSKKLQRADWSRRPLTPAMIEYAAADTAYLPALKDELAKRLEKMGRLHWAEEEFNRLERVRWTQTDGGDAFLRIKGARTLPPKGLAVLKAVWEWREREAASLDRAPFRVIHNSALITIARVAPKNTSALSRTEGVPQTIASRHGSALVAAVTRGLAVPEKDWPRFEHQTRPQTDPDAQQRYQRLRDLRMATARIVELDQGLLCPNGTLLAIARAAPTSTDHLARIVELRQWQREALGDDAILEAAR